MRRIVVALLAAAIAPGGVAAAAPPVPGGHYLVQGRLVDASARPTLHVFRRPTQFTEDSWIRIRGFHCRHGNGRDLDEIFELHRTTWPLADSFPHPVRSWRALPPLAISTAGRFEARRTERIYFQHLKNAYPGGSRSLWISGHFSSTTRIDGWMSARYRDGGYRGCATGKARFTARLDRTWSPD